MSASFFIVTFGCKVNQYDGEALRESLLRAGAVEQALAAGPDFVVVNTCTVTATADAKARRFIRQAARRAPAARVVVTGCAVERDAALIGKWPCVWQTVGAAHRSELVALVAGPHAAPDGPAGIVDFAGHARAFVKVQDGCDAACSYCIVPLVRGEPRSRPLGEILEEVGRLAPRFREIVLTGIHLGLYRDGSGADLAALAARLLDIPAVGRVRLSSLELNELTPALLNLAASTGRLCPHFHVPLQSGSDRVLARMNRRYTAAEFLARLDRVRARLDRPAFTSDVMAGFPGETDADFADTLRACEAAAFSRIHVFRFSPRPGTPAASLPGRCRASVVAAREKTLAELATRLAAQYVDRSIGATAHVLVEARRDGAGRWTGYSERYVRVHFDGPDSLAGRIVPVVITGAAPGGASGRPAPKNT